MKISVTSYSYGQYINEDKLGLMGIIDNAAEMGFAGIEFSEGGWSNNLDLAVAEKIKERCAERGIEVVSYCVGANFLAADLDAEIERVKKQVDFAAAMGTKNMRHDVGYGFSGRKYSIGYDDALPYLAKGALEVTKYAEQKGVGTMTENHGYFSQDAARVEKLINTVAHPNLRRARRHRQLHVRRRGSGKVGRNHGSVREARTRQGLLLEERHGAESRRGLVPDPRDELYTRSYHRTGRS